MSKKMSNHTPYRTNLDIPSLKKHLAEHLPKHKPKQLAETLQLLSDIALGKYSQHRTKPEAMSISRKEFLRYISAHAYNTRNHLVFHLVKQVGDYSFNNIDPTKNRTLAWRLDKDFNNLLGDYYLDEIYYYDSRFDTLIRNKPRKNEIISDYTHKTNISKLGLNLLKEKLSELSEDCSDASHYIPIQTLADALATLPPSFPLHYNRVENGRLVNVALETPALQGIKKGFRQYLFKGQYEYDMVACAPAVLSQLYAKVFAKRLYQIELFVGNVDLFRQALVNVGVPFPTAKKFFTQIFFGAGVNSLIILLGEDTYERVIAIPEIQDLISEINTLFSELAERYKGLYKNGDRGFYGTELCLKGKTRQQIVANLYMVLESYLLGLLCQRYEHSLLIYDAFVSTEDVEVEDMREYLAEVSGFKIDFRKTLLEC